MYSVDLIYELATFADNTKCKIRVKILIYLWIFKRKEFFY